MNELLIDNFEKKNINNQNKESISNYFFFFSFWNLLRKAQNKKVNIEDIKIYTEKKRININNENIIINKGKNILNVLINRNKLKISYIVFLSVLRILLMISNPFLFKQFSKKKINIILLSLFILLIDFFRTFLSLKIELNSHLLCLSVDNQIKQLIIKNDLLMNNNKENKSINEKISLSNTIFNNDIENIKHFFYLFSNFFSIPLLFISYYLVLYILFGFMGLFSCIFLILIILVNIHLQGKLKIGQQNKQRAIDERMKFMTNLIYKIRNIKILLYEKYFFNKIMEKRNEELKKYEILYQTANKIRSLLWISPTFLILVTIVGYIIYNIYYQIEIYPENLLIIFGLIDSFQQPILTLCQTYSYFLISNVSIKRIEKYLSNDSIDNTQKEKEVKNEEKSSKIKFEDIILGKNEIIFIIGDTGSGKSYLFEKLFNFYKNNNKNYHLIFSGQEPFILNDSIKSNIFFMKDKDKINNEEYLKILKISCLESGLSLMEKGDLTMAGDGGSCLSGGQKKRISIARALLECEVNKLKEQIIFFDEPTYSLDPQTFVDIWNYCFIDYLKNTIRLIATNNLELLKYGNRIIYIENKEIIFFGNYSEFKNNKEIYDKYLKLDSLFKQRKNENNKYFLDINNNKNNNKQIISQKNKQIIQSNANDIKIVKSKLYINFIKIMIGGFGNFYFLLLILFIWMILRFFSEYFLALFKNKEFFGISFSIKKLIIFYIAINLFACLLLYIRLVLTSKYTISGGKNLHKMMIEAITKIPISNSNKNFNLNQLINNFSRDLGMVDFFSSVMFGNCLTFGGAFITLLIVAIVFFRIFVIFIPIFIFIGFFITKIYLKGFRQLVQLETQMRTAIINFIKEINFGNEEIQIYNVGDKFIKKFNQIYEKYYLSQIGVKYSNAWFLYSISRISFILKIIFMVNFFYQYKNNLIEQSKIGILFISMFSLHEYFNRFLSHVVTFENSLLAFNRCLGTTNIKQEDNNKNENLFSNGIQKEIKFENVCIKYDKASDYVLKNISFKVNKNEKIGICGKTGVGKTTLLMSLLKVVEVNEGNIIFDENIDIKDINSNTLRENIICVTQEINLFDELTIKENIDPYNKYEIEDIKNILNDFSFNEFIDLENKNDCNTILNLDSIWFKKVKDINLSFGQKNIICLIRVILKYNEKRNSIVLIDEMIDKNDFITSDKLINILFNKFNEGTIFIVSHRMESIKNCDKILVLEEGKIAEFDSPEKLLGNENSIFYKYNKL